MQSEGAQHGNPMFTRSQSHDKNKVCHLSLLDVGPHSPKVKGSSSLPSVTLNALNDLSERISSLELGQQRILEKLEGLSSQVSSSSAPSANENTSMPEETIRQVQALNNHLLEQKREIKLQDACTKIKSKILFKWKDTQNIRKQCYFNSIRNSGKADLYAQWYEESPDYLPLHLRPHVNTNERQDIVDTKVNEAKSKYFNSIATMRTSADINKAKVISFDEEMISFIESQSNEETLLILLRKWWESDSESAQNTSEELWEKKRAFLVKVKVDAEKDGTNVLTKTKTPKMVQNIDKRGNKKQNTQNSTNSTNQTGNNPPQKSRTK